MVKLKKKLSSSGLSAKEKMEQRKKDLKERKKGGSFIYIKEGTLRCRIKSPGQDEEIGLEVIYFYDPKSKTSILSPATFDEPCPYMEKYLELKDSDDEVDKDLAKKLIPKRKYALGLVPYKDIKGKEIDTENLNRLYLAPGSVYQDIIEYYLDEDDWGDMTDPIEGYDIKIIRQGSGQMDTNYTVSPCQKSKLPKEYRDPIDLEGKVRAEIEDYDTLKKKLKEFLKNSEMEDEGDKPTKKSFKDKKKLKKKKYKSDI